MCYTAVKFRLLLLLLLLLILLYYYYCGPGSSVAIATDYWLDDPGIEFRWGRNFSPVQTGPGPHLASCTMGTGSLPGVKCGRGVLLTTHSLQAPRSSKSRGTSIPLPPLGYNRACNGVILPLLLLLLTSWSRVFQLLMNFPAC
jgi:hypothetical protein